MKLRARLGFWLLRSCYPAWMELRAIDDETRGHGLLLMGPFYKTQDAEQVFSSMNQERVPDGRALVLRMYCEVAKRDPVTKCGNTSLLNLLATAKAGGRRVTARASGTVLPAETPPEIAMRTGEAPAAYILTEPPPGKST